MSRPWQLGSRSRRLPRPRRPQPRRATHFSGTLADGATWIADVPSDWNGVLLLYSHGFGPLIAADAPDPASAAALLDRGYALAGSSYDPNGSWWALQNAVRDQFQTIDAATANALPHAPSRVIAVGSSMGGLISALEAQQGAGHIDGALSTCGIVAGGIQLNNYQLDGEYVMTKLLATTPIQLVNFFPDFNAGIATGFTLQAVANQAQTTPQGRARLALAMAFLNATPDAPGQPAPSVPGSRMRSRRRSSRVSSRAASRSSRSSMPRARGSRCRPAATGRGRTARTSLPPAALADAGQVPPRTALPRAAPTAASSPPHP